MAAAKHRAEAQRLFHAEDGAGCLTQLTEADRLDPEPDRLSTAPGGALYGFRARCEMLAGNCELGKRMYRVSLERDPVSRTPSRIDAEVADMAGMFCRGGAGMTFWDRLAGSNRRLRDGYAQGDGELCRVEFVALATLLAHAEPAKTPDETMMLDSAGAALPLGPRCVALAGDCARGKALERERLAADVAAGRALAASLEEPLFTQQFERLAPNCKAP